MPKRLLTIGLSIIALVAVVTVVMLGIKATPAEPKTELVDQAITSTRDAINRATSVDGQPLATVKLPDQTDSKAIAGQLLVKIANPDDAAAFGERIRPAGPPQTYILTVAQDADLNESTAAVSRLPGVQAVSPNYIVTKTVTPNDPLYASNQWNLPKISAPAAWDRTTGQSSTVIASVDTGVNYNHQDLASKSWQNTADTPGNGLDDDNNGYVDDNRGMDFVNAGFVGGKFVNDGNGAMDDQGHGSLTASVFAGATNNGVGLAGVNWQARIMPVKVLGSDGYGSFLDVANGIRYAATAGAKVISMSLGAFGVTYDFATEDAIAYAISRNAVLVAASGNDGSSTTIDYPAYSANVIAVGATTSTDARAGYSNGGSRLSIMAPGSGIPGVLGVSGGVPVNSGYATASGTSLSTPHVAGLAGLMAAVKPQVTAGEARTILQNSADKVAGMGGQNRTDLYGYGRINAERALNSLQAYSSQWVGQSAWPTVGSGEQTTLTVDYKNTGLQAWSSVGSNPVRLITSHGLGRSSLLADSSWIDPTRPATFSGRLETNGTVTSTNTIAPGETARFQFTVTGVPTSQTKFFSEYVQLVAENAAFMEDHSVFWGVTVTPRSYSYAFAGQNFPATLNPGARQASYLDLTNTGTATWRRNSSTFPFRLITSRPLGRNSVFTNDSWINPTRPATFAGKVSGGTVVNQDAIAPGETARFAFDLLAPNPGSDSYAEYFQPVVENFAFLPDQGMFFSITVPKAYSSQWVGQSAWPTVGASEQTTLYLDYKNTGTQSWSSTGANPVRLITSRPLGRNSAFADNSWINPTRPATFAGRVEQNGSLTATSAVAPGETARFQFSVTGVPVNQTQGFAEYFQVVAENAAFMEDQGVFFNVTVTPRSYSYAFAGQSFPAVLQPGARVASYIDLTNTGTATWRRNSPIFPFRLITGRPLGRSSALANDSWINPTRPATFAGKVSGVSVVNQDAISPGETARFSFDLLGPSQGGGYNEYFQPVVENYAFLPDQGIFFPTYVPSSSALDYDYEMVGQSPWPTMNRGEQVTLKLQLRNSGRQSWVNNGPNATKLITDRPKGRGSGFYTAGNWESNNRIKLTRNLTDPAKNVGTDTTIAMGEVAEFEFVVTGNPPPGRYVEYFSPMTEGIVFMKDIGIFWMMSVETPVTVGLAGQSSVYFASGGAMTLRNEAGQVLDIVPPFENITLSYTGQYVAQTARGSFSSASPIRAEQEPGKVITVHNLADNPSFNQFRGDLFIKNGSPGVWLVNSVNLEDYLYGLGEVPDSWPAEAIRAQVVAARTYAARKIQFARNEVFQMHDDTRDQVYNGWKNEVAKPNHVAAINNSGGLVMYYGGQLIQAFYSSDSGGATEANENVWGGAPIPYLRAVGDPWEKPDAWQKVVSNATLQANFGVPGNINGIEVLEAYPSGRLKTLRITTTSGQFIRTYTADTMRSKLTLRSSRVVGIGRSGNDWLFSGRGFGHGIGLAQWGAYNQARQGRNAGHIISTYYPGVVVGSFY